MQRDIEFRIWDTKEKIMLTENNWWEIVNNNTEKYLNDECYPYYYLITNLFEQNIHQENDRFIVMQYTCLKDKNGTKIFEGDIIQLDDDYRKAISSCNAKTEEDLVRKNCLVGYKDGAFMFCRNRYIIDNFNSYLWLAVNHCKVIGNIYEKRELID